MTILAIIPCSAEKVWSREPGAPLRVPMRDAYVGGYHLLARRYAELVADEVLVLSALYGFRPLDQRISDYDVTWSDEGHISERDLKEQMYQHLLRKLGSQITEIVVIAGKEYCARVVKALGENTRRPVRCVLQDQKLRGIGAQQQWLKQQIATLEADAGEELEVEPVRQPDDVQPVPADPGLARDGELEWHEFNARVDQLRAEAELESEKLRREMVQRALKECHNEVTAAAELLGISRGRLYGELRVLGIQSKPRGRGRSSPSATLARHARRWRY